MLIFSTIRAANRTLLLQWPVLFFTLIIFRVAHMFIQVCTPLEVSVANLCVPRRTPGQSCEFNQQCPTIFPKLRYYCIDDICQLPNMASPSKSNNFDVHSYNSYPIGTTERQQENALPMSVLSSPFLQPQAAPTDESFQNFQTPPKRFSSWAPRQCNSWDIQYNNKCYPKRNPGQPCIINDQCITPTYYRRHRRQTGYLQYVCDQGICSYLSAATLLCSNSQAPQTINGVVLSCIAQQCGVGYRCEYIYSGGGQYACCPISAAAIISSGAVGYDASSLTGLPTNLPINSGCVSTTCSAVGNSRILPCGCPTPQSEILCCPQPLTQTSLNFGFLQWTISLNFIPCYNSNNGITNQFSYCYSPTVKVVASVIQLLPVLATTTTTATTTTATTTTTTTPTTTTTTVLPCASCTMNELTLTQGTQPGEMPMVPGGIQIGADGCASITVICDASSVAGAIVFMEFNNGQFGGPTTGNLMPIVSATFTCSTAGVWTFTSNGVSATIFEVQCTTTT